MKRIALFLAAAAATLASCVKENTLAPEQTADNLVTIKALATKTTLDENIVIWEQDDEIAVVLEGLVDAVNFGIDGEVNGASAKFVGTIAPETEYNSAYAVYPATAYTVEAGIAKITHSLPETQTGVITSGMILSSALLDAEELKAGNATANFHNALTLVKVIVPAGVQSVSLTSDNLSGSLVGSSTFNAPDGAGVLKKTGEILTRRTVTLSTGSELTAGTYDLLVYPGTVNTLTLTMEGTDGAEYTSAVPGITFKAGEYRTIDLTKVFKMDVEANSEVPVSSTGGTFEVNVVAVGDKTYYVAIEDGNSWIQYVQTKAFNSKTIEFNVESNPSTSPRDADITITWEGGSREFTVVQEGKPELSFVYVDGDPNNELIHWKETFGVYKDDNLTTKVTDFENSFTIDLSNDPSKGTYKISNLFTNNTGGGIYYADFNSKNNELTVYTSESASPSRTYYFDDTVILLYDPSTETFISKLEAFTANTLFSFTGYSNKIAFIGNYSASKVDESTTEPSGIEALYGEYVESVQLGWSGDPETLVISESDNPAYDLKMLFAYTEDASTGTYDIGYGKVNPEGTTITVTILGDSNFYGPVEDFVLTVSDGVISGKYAGQKDYTATKKAAFNPASLYGEYVESVQLGGWGDPETLVISESDNPAYDLKMLFAYTEDASPYTYDTAYGKVSADGKSIVVTIPGGSSNFFGSVSDFTLTVDGNVISGNYAGMVPYTATKK